MSTFLFHSDRYFNLFNATKYKDGIRFLKNVIINFQIILFFHRLVWRISVSFSSFHLTPHPEPESSSAKIQTHFYIFSTLKRFESEHFIFDISCKYFISLHQFDFDHIPQFYFILKKKMSMKMKITNISSNR